MKLDERIEVFKRTLAPDLWPEIERREPVTELSPAATGWRRLAVIAAALAIGAAALILVLRAFPRHDAAVPSNPTPANEVIAYAPIGEEQVFWTISPDGSEKTKVLVDVPGFVGVPSWSSDGSEIAFAVNSYDDPHPEAGNWDIYVANADGSDPKRLTTDRVDHNPAWSPDGTQIAYVYGYGDDQQIRVMNADGSDVRELTSDHGFHSFPTWSPDGSQIAYVGFEGTNANIYVMSADGSGSHRVTDDPAHEDAPAWSPDGRLIAFTSEGGSRDPGIYTMSPDGTGVTEWAHDPDPANLGIAWSPDGSKMALVSIRGPGNDRNVYVLDAESRELVTVGQPGAYYGVSWQPVSESASPTPSPSLAPSVYLKSVPDFTVDATRDTGPVLLTHQYGGKSEVIADGGSAPYTVATGTRVLVSGTAKSIAWGWGPSNDHPYDKPVAISRHIPIVVMGSEAEHLLLRLKATWADGTTGEWTLAFTVTVPPRDELTLACPIDERLKFEHTGGSLMPGADVFIRANVGGVTQQDAVVQVTWPDGPGSWNGIWAVYREGALVAFVQYEGLSGVACRGTGIGGV